MKKKQRLMILVTGKAPFPIDMLRYDSCHPATESDSRNIIASMTEDIKDKLYTVALVKIDSDLKAWTNRRWESFGWEVNIRNNIYG